MSEIDNTVPLHRVQQRSQLCPFKATIRGIHGIKHQRRAPFLVDVSGETVVGEDGIVRKGFGSVLQHLDYDSVFAQQGDISIEFADGFALGVQSLIGRLAPLLEGIVRSRFVVEGKAHGSDHQEMIGRLHRHEG